MRIFDVSREQALEPTQLIVAGAWPEVELGDIER